MASTNSTGKDQEYWIMSCLRFSPQQALAHYLSINMEETKASSSFSMAGTLFLTHYSFHCIINCPCSCSQWPQQWLLSYSFLNASCILTPATAKDLLGGLYFVAGGHVYIYYNTLGLEIKILIFVRRIKQNIQWQTASLATPRLQRKELNKRLACTWLSYFRLFLKLKVQTKFFHFKIQ